MYKNLQIEIKKRVRAIYLNGCGAPEVRQGYIL